MRRLRLAAPALLPALLVPALLVPAGGCRGSAPAAAPAPVGSAAAADSLLMDVRAADSTIRVEARYATADNFTGAPLPGYGGNRALLRREAAAALARVQARLRPRGLGLKVFDGYRPVRATGAMVDWAARTGRIALVDGGYIARRSRHNLGVAVDLTVIRLADGTELDMGTPFDTFDSSAHTANASGEVRQNRELLVSAMEAEGFANYEQEWWHFSYPVDGAVPFDVPVR